jgi:hypothetical protein
MARRLVDLTLDNLYRLPARCRACVFWELDPVTGERRASDGEGDVAKQAWLSMVLLEWGSCGKLVFVDDEVAGYVTYAPPGYVPRALAFPTSPVSPDAVLLMTAHVVPRFGGGGLGRLLMQAVAKDLTRRGVQAIEAFGDARGTGSCVAPVEYLRAVGFGTVRPHVRFPRMRLDLRTAVSWREDVGSVLERLLGSLQPDPLPRATRSAVSGATVSRELR